MLTTVVAVLLVALTAPGEAQIATVPVAVYYESLCPDSIQFFKTQLTPTWNELSRFMDLTLVPFGKSKSNGLFNLTCHHGPEECHGNKVQACALVHIPNNSTKVKFISCVMEYMEGKSKTSAYPDKQCADTVGVTDYSTIRNCVDMQEGDNLMLSLENKTRDLGRGDSLSVPTIVFNSMFNETAQTMSLTSFKSVLCGYIPGNDKLEECSGAVVNTATLTLTLVTALFARLSQ